MIDGYTIFELMAMALDTLPESGRIVLMAGMLATALYGFSRVIADHESLALQAFFRKGAFVSLIAVPLIMWIIGLRMPVYVEVAEAFSTQWPRYISWIVVAVWLVGALSVGGRYLYRARQTLAAGTAVSPATETVQKRAAHWRARLGLKDGVVVLAGGGEMGWVLPGRLIVPAASANWPKGTLDAMLLCLMAQNRERCWQWGVFANLVAALYWPIPWIARLAEEFADILPEHASRIAEAAYRDPDGWRRDVRKMQERAETLAAVGHGDDRLIRLPLVVQLKNTSQKNPESEEPEQTTFESKWANTRARRAARYFDPLERVYWLIASACIVVATTTTLTIEQASPEFEPAFLKVRWQDRMGPRLTERNEVPDPKIGEPEKRESRVSVTRAAED